MTDADPLAAIRQRFLLRLAQQREELERLSSHIDGNRQTQDIVHKIAGIAGSLGFPALSETASEVEMLLARESMADLRSSGEMKALMSCIDAALDAD